jgi:hypothetical protein
LSLLRLLLLLLLLVSFLLGFLLLAASSHSAGYGANARARTGVSGDGSDSRSTCGTFGGALSSRSFSGVGRVLTLLSGLRVLRIWLRLNLSGVVALGFILSLLVLRLIFVRVGVNVQRSRNLALSCWSGLVRRGLRRRRRLLLLCQHGSRKHGYDESNFHIHTPFFLSHAFLDEADALS